jgi:predicted HD phosphohydrolase
MPTVSRNHIAIRRASSIEDVIVLMHTASRYTAGEDLSVLDHSLQTADILRRAFPDDLELQVAGLLHDVDQVIGCHPSMHGDIAAEYLGAVVHAPVIGLILLHVPAKRYLISRDPCYRNRLSAASEVSLRSQGDHMPADEAERFADNSLARRAIALRRADEQAKSSAVRTPALASWFEVLSDPIIARAMPHPR